MRSLLATLVLASVVLVAAPAAAEEEAPAATPGRRVNVDFVVGGLVSAGSAYAFAAFLGTRECYGDSDVCKHRGDMLIPFAGPMMQAVRLAAMPLPPPVDVGLEVFLGSHGVRWLGVGLLAADSLVQVGGVALATVGLLRGKPAPRASVKPTVNLALGFSHVGLSGTF